MDQETEQYTKLADAPDHETRMMSFKGASLDAGTTRTTRTVMYLLLAMTVALAMVGLCACKDSRITEPVGTAATGTPAISQGSASSRSASSASGSTSGSTSRSSSKSTSEELVDNPIDFASLQAVNVDVYAWLYIPNTNVNYAVCQSSTNYMYYLDHNSDGEYSGAGAIYSEAPNSLDFSDPVTVIYGHDAYNGEMFSTLHDFEDADFFNANQYFYIYTPGHILTYEIVSAYQYDDRHILNSFNFYDETVRLDYFNYVQNPTDIIQNVRQGITLTADSKLVQLSTCMTSDTDTGTRYIVSGVLIDDQPTR